MTGTLSAIEVALWEMLVVNLGDFLNQIPAAPLAPGHVELSDADAPVFDISCHCQLFDPYRPDLMPSGSRVPIVAANLCRRSYILSTLFM